MPTKRRLVALAAVLGLASLAVPASGREGGPVAGVLVERVITAVGTVHPDERPPSVSETSGFERRVDPSGRTLSEGGFPVSSAGPLEPVGSFGCSGRGSPPGYRDHSQGGGPVRLEADVGGAAARAVFHVYSLAGAREVEGGPTTQVLVCSAGGARAGAGQRLLQAGVGGAYDDAAHSHIIGKRWLVGPAPARAEDGYAFAGGDGEAGATGYIEQDPVGELEGSFLGPFPTDFDDYFRNALAGWWEHPCLDGAGCTPADGSAAFQGSLAGGLWEFYDPPRDYQFRLALFFAVACVDLLSCP